jgi:drug/metabolite transporter (DMT)-like permease|tara:strand:- start:109 stop:1011 length:903 start_codon:yes stop_codon:yes gene_type:complete
MENNFQRSNYFIILAFGAMLIGFAPIFVKWSMLSSSAIAFYRMFFAIPFLFIFNYTVNKRFSFKVNNKSTILYTAFASLAFTTDLTLWHFSMTITSVSNATIIVNSAPIFVAILSFIIFKEKLSKGFLLSFLITYIGIIGLIYFSNNYSNGKFLGDLLCLVAAFFYGVYLLIIAKLGKEKSLNIIFYTTFFCCIFSIIPMIIEGGNIFPASSFEWINLILLAFLCQFGGQYFITHAIGKISASSGSIGLLMQPITATILAVIIFTDQEKLNAIQVIFVLVAMFGIYLARINLSNRQQKQT